jgi:hypothetical protein
MKKFLTIFSICFLVACGNKTPNKTNVQDNISGNVDSTKTKTEVLDDARPSPLKRTSGYIGGVKTIIQWGSPSVKGREIWGMIVPYDEVWRTGANEATTIEFDKDVMINDKELKAGKYGFFTIPRAGEWTIIFNSVWNQWGAFEYDEKKDALRFNLKPVENPLSETLEYSIDPDGISMTWEKLKLKLNVKAK